MLPKALLGPEQMDSLWIQELDWCCHFLQPVLAAVNLWTLLQAPVQDMGKTWFRGQLKELTLSSF